MHVEKMCVTQQNGLWSFALVVESIQGDVYVRPILPKKNMIVKVREYVSHVRVYSVRSIYDRIRVLTIHINGEEMM